MKRREMGHGLQFDESSEVKLIDEKLRPPAIVNSEELLEHQPSQQLRLCEFLRAVLVQVCFERFERTLVLN